MNKRDNKLEQLEFHYFPTCDSINCSVKPIKGLLRDEQVASHDDVDSMTNDCVVRGYSDADYVRYILKHSPRVPSGNLPREKLLLWVNAFATNALYCSQQDGGCDGGCLSSPWEYDYIREALMHALILFKIDPALRSELRNKFDSIFHNPTRAGGDICIKDIDMQSISELPLNFAPRELREIPTLGIKVRNFRDWSFDWGRHCKGNRVEQNVGIKHLEELIVPLSLGDEAVIELKYHFARGYGKGKVEPNLLSQPYYAAEACRIMLDSIPAPECYSRRLEKVCWLMMLILGFGGRKFKFVRAQVAALMSNDGKQIDRVVKNMVALGFVKVANPGCWSGRKGGLKHDGVASVFRLADKDDWYRVLEVVPMNILTNKGENARKIWIEYLSEHITTAFDFKRGLKNFKRRNRVR